MPTLNTSNVKHSIKPNDILQTQKTPRPPEPIGAIRDKWLQLGGPKSLLGLALTEELATPDGVGRYNHFKGGSIYWTPSTGAHEVHGQIRDKWAALGWERSHLGYPVTDEMATPDGVGRFTHFQGGSIYWTPSTGAHEVHGKIRDRWSSLGWERSYLGFPVADEQAIPEGGRMSQFQNGAIYWWPDTRAIDLRDVVVHYTGLMCFGETDIDHGSGDDEPYATIGVTAADGSSGTFRTAIYEGVDAGESRPDVIEIYRGKPRGLVINTLLQEHSAGDTNLSRAAMEVAVKQASTAVTQAATMIPYVGPVLGPAAGWALDSLRDDILEVLNDFVERTLGFADRPLGADCTALTLKQMVTLATRPEGNLEFNGIGYRFESSLLSRFGATYKVYFGVVPA